MYIDGFILEYRCRSLRVVEVVKLVGLIACERILYRHRAILLILSVRRDSVLGGFDHMEDDDQDKGDEEIREGVEALEREKEINGRRANAQSDT